MESNRPVILLVDDDLDAAQVTSFYLQHQGNYEVALATSGEEALARVQEIRPDLILTDVHMSPVNGFEVCRRLKADPETSLIPVVFVTARAEVQAVVEGLALGADDYIIKPFEFAELLARVRVMLRLRDLQRQLVEQERLRALVEMAGAAAHELNQPLTVLQGHVELLQRELADLVGVQARCGRILEAAGRISAIVRGMGEVRRYRTRPYAGTQEIIDLAAAAGRE